MISESVRKAIEKRATISDEWDYGVHQSWEVVLSILSENFDGTINFIENDCTADEFSWLSEVFSEIVDIFPSKRIIAAFKKAASKYPVEVEKFNLNYCIDEAEEHLNFILSLSETGKDGDNR